MSIFAGEVAPGEAGGKFTRFARVAGGKSLGGSWQKVIRCRRNFLFSRVIAEEVLRVHRRDPIDVMEMEESFGWHAEIARLTGIPVLVRLHGPAFLSLIEEELDTEYGKKRIEREGAALHLAEMIVSPCSATLSQTIDRYNIANEEIHHIVYPVALHEDRALWAGGLRPSQHSVRGSF